MQRFQFSMKWMLVAIAAICVLLFLSVTFRNFVDLALGSIVWCLLPTPLVIVAIYARGDWQAASIGALIPWIALMFLRIPVSSSLLLATFWLVPMSVICGIVAGVTRRWIVTNLRG